MEMPDSLVLIIAGTAYQDWFRPSINLSLDDFDDEYLDRATSATCPNCKHKVALDVLVVREDGVWEMGSE